MKTSIVKYTRYNKTVTFVGVMHIATKQYYEKIENILSKFKDNTVLYEGVGNASNNESLVTYTLLLMKLADILDLTFQKDGVEYKKDWINSDMDIDDLEVINGGTIFKKIDTVNFDRLAENKKRTKFIFKIVLKMLKLLSRGINKPVLLEIRNNKVIMDTFRTLKDNDDVAIFYGDMHEKGIGKYLKSVGFKREVIEQLNPME